MTYTWNWSSWQSVWHWLSKAPEMVIYKRYNTDQNWIVWHNSFTWTQSHLIFKTDAVWYASNLATTTNSSTINIGTHNAVNSSDLLAYAFHSVPGYSKVWSYTGNWSADGPFVYTGFKPRYVMIKNTGYTAGTDWFIFDTERDNNSMLKFLRPNLSTAETEDWTYFDILSNWFKLRHSSYALNQNYKYIYIAFAEAPFKYANAR